MLFASEAGIQALRQNTPTLQHPMALMIWSHQNLLLRSAEGYQVVRSTVGAENLTFEAHWRFESIRGE